MKKIQVGAVSYLNTKPFLYGLSQSDMGNLLDLVVDYPSKIAQQLKNGIIDIGLVPVAIIPEIKNAQIIGDYCIAADGEVASVCLFSQVPLSDVTTVLLDYQSRTSVQLARTLLKHFWKKEVRFIKAEQGFEKQIDGTTAGVVIGDRALQMRHSIKYIYDLSQAWKEFTSLPFVFAAWTANKPIDNTFLERFNQAISIGVENLELVSKQQDFPHYSIHHYYTQNIQFKLDEKKRLGLKKFLEYCSEDLS